MRAGAKGIKLRSGRLNGAVIAQQKDTLKELFHFTLRADIDYAWEEAEPRW